MPEIAAKKQDDEPDGLRARFEKDLKTAKKFMDPIHQLMDKYYEMYRNRWSDNPGDFSISDLYAYVETVVPILTNNRTRSVVKAEHPDVVKHAEGMNYILDNTFDVNNWDYNAQRIARMAEVYRSAIAYTGYDTEAKNGTGQLSIKEINIRWCYLDSSVVDLQESNYFYYVEPTRPSRVIKQYKNKEKDIKESLGRRDANMGADTQKVNGWFTSWVRSVKNLISFNSNNTGMNRLQEYQLIPELDEQEKRSGSVALIHYWYRDEETDKWRVSYWADDVFLEDLENPFWHEQLPYDIYNPTEDILSSMGIPMAEHIENLNLEKNVFMDLIIQSAKRAVDPVLLFNTAMGIKDPQALREQAKNKGTVGVNNPDMVPLSALAEFFIPPPLPAYAEHIPDRFSTMEDRITGVNDSFRGMSEATSGKEVQLKQEAAYTRIKTKVDNYEKFTKSISQKTIVNAMQFCKDTRAYRVKGDYSKYANMQEGDMPFEAKPIQRGTDAQGQPIHDKEEFFLYANPHEWTELEDKPDEQDGAQQPGAASQPAAAPQSGAMGQPSQQQPDGTGQPNQASDQTDNGQDDEEDTEPAADQAAEQGTDKATTQRAYRILQMTVEIEAGSSLPTSPMARKEEAHELFKDGAIDQQALLDAYEFPNADEIVKRMSEAAQATQKATMDSELQKIQATGQARQAPAPSPTESIKMADLPPEGQVQMAKRGGIDITVDQIIGHQITTAQVSALSKPQPQQTGQTGDPNQQQPGQQQQQQMQPGQQQQPQQPDVAGGLDKIRQAVPELANMPDDVLMKLFAGMGQQQPQGAA